MSRGMSGYDPTGWERRPFDGRSLTPPLTSKRQPLPGGNHGPTCRPSNPEIGCECGYAEWLDEQRELAELRAAGYGICQLCGLVYDRKTSEHFTPEQMAAMGGVLR